MTKRILDAQGKDVSTLAFDQEYRVEVTVRSEAARKYVMVEDPLPAGVEVVKDRPDYNGWGFCWWCGGWSEAEVHDDRVAFFSDWLQGERTFTYTIRGVWPGSYHALPAHAEAMYDPSAFGRSEARMLEVGSVPSAYFGRVSLEHDVLDVELLLRDVAGTPPQQGIVNITATNATGAALNLTSVLSVLNGTLHGKAQLPHGTVHVALVARAGELTAQRSLDLDARAVSFAGEFSGADEKVWSSGTPLVASAPVPEPVVDVRVFEPSAPPGPGHEPQPAPPGPSPPTSHGVPFPGWVLLVAVGAAVLLLRRR